MKKCPECNQIFAADEAFCIDDGTPLITHFDGTTNFSGFSVSLEQPTQFVPNPTHGQIVPPPYYPTPPPSNAVPKNDSKLLYVFIGALMSIVLGMGGFFFLTRGSDEKSSSDNADWTQVNAPNTSQSPVNRDFATNKSETAAVKTPKPVNTNKPVNTMPTGQNTDSPPPRFFSRNYSGTVNNDVIEMRLTRNGSALGGKVIPQNRYADISVSGSIDEDGYFEMSEYSDIGVVTGIYRGRISGGGTISGTWSKPNGSSTRSLYLRSN